MRKVQSTRRSVCLRGRIPKGLAERVASRPDFDRRGRRCEGIGPRLVLALASGGDPAAVGRAERAAVVHLHREIVQGAGGGLVSIDDGGSRRRA